MLNGRFVRILRKKQKMSQTVLAEKAGVELRTIQWWEDGSHQPTEKNLFALAEALGVTPAELNLNFYQLLQEEAIITLFKLKQNLEMVDPEDYDDHLYTYHDAVIKTLKVGGVDGSVAWKNNRAADNIEKDYGSQVDDDSEVDVDSIVEEFENGDHDDVVDENLPKASDIDPFE